MIDKDRVKNAVREILFAIGEDPDREGLLDTPDRVARMYEEIFSGLHTDPMSFQKVFKEDNHEEMILVKDIPFYSMCEHHLIPFMGVAHVAYIPRQGTIIGISKLARIVDNISKKPQLQERISSEVADLVMEYLNPIGVAVAIEAEHLCMTMRGIKKRGSKTFSSTMRGIFKSDNNIRLEFMSIVNNK